MTLLPCRLLATLALLAGIVGAAVPGSARAETFQTCAGFIDSLPATISKQGVWCLRKDLATNITGGGAINIVANNVTIDCNHFKLGGLAAGPSSGAFGIHANDQQNVTVRHCNIRGFNWGIRLAAGAGHLIEDNRLDNNLYVGIYVNGENSLVQRNRIYDTGGTGSNQSFGILASADVIDNTVAGVYATGTSTYPTAIRIDGGTGSLVRNNRVRGLVSTGTGYAYGIRIMDMVAAIDGNQLMVPAGTQGAGIYGTGTGKTACSNNFVSGFSIALSACLDNGGNVEL